MKTSADFLDDIRIKLKLRFDGDVAELFGWKSSQISRYRTLESAFSERTAIRVAHLLEIEPDYVIACMRAQSARRPEIKTIWERIARKVAMLMLGAVAGLLAAPSPAPAATSHNANVSFNGPEYTLRNNQRRRWRLIAWLFGALTLAGCAGSPTLYTIPDAAPAERAIFWARVTDAELAVFCPELARAARLAGRRLNACTSYDANVCTIYSRRDVTKETIGDEFLHCYLGAYHP